MHHALLIIHVTEVRISADKYKKQIIKKCGNIVSTIHAFNPPNFLIIIVT
jgi:hypothetical protein